MGIDTLHRGVPIPLRNANLPLFLQRAHLQLRLAQALDPAIGAGTFHRAYQMVYLDSGVAVEVVRRDPGILGFHLLPKSWSAARTFARLGTWREFVRYDKHLVEFSTAGICLAMPRLRLHRLARFT